MGFRGGRATEGSANRVGTEGRWMEEGWDRGFNGRERGAPRRHVNSRDAETGDGVRGSDELQEFRDPRRCADTVIMMAWRDARREVPHTYPHTTASCSTTVAHRPTHSSSTVTLAYRYTAWRQEYYGGRGS
eukprot:658777-Rhodomonas_salina.1